MRQFSLFLFLVLSVICTELTAQEEELPTGSVIVEKDYELELLDFNKIMIRPDEPVDPEAKDYPYVLADKVLDVEYPAPKIKSAGYRAQSSYLLGYKSYARLGYGLPNSLYGKLSYGDFVTDNIRLQGNLFYRDIEDDSYDYREGNKFRLNIQGDYQSDYEFEAKANAFYQSNKTVLYGYNHDDTSLHVGDSVIPENQFDFYGLTLGISDTKGEQNPLSYSANIGIDQFNTNHDLKENSFDIDGKLEKWFGRIPVRLGIDADLTKIEYDTIIDDNLDIIRIRPGSGYHSNDFRIDGALNLAYYNDEFTIFPEVEVAVNLIGSGLQLYAGIDGDATPLTHQFIANDNAYILPSLSEYTYQEVWDYYGGVQGIISNWKYFGQLGYKKVNNLNLYRSNELFVSEGLSNPVANNVGITEYDVLLDSGSIFYAKGSLEFPLNENVQLLTGIQYNAYDLDREEKAWYLPNLLFNAGLNINLMENKLNVQTTFAFANKVEAPSAEDSNDDRKVNTLTDLSVSADWFIVDNIGLFLDINNILDNNYARFYDYQSTGVNVNFGVVARL